jgi:hypothetical protein
MPYTQKEYDSLVNDVESGQSSLLVAFANLLERFDINISPVSLQESFNNSGVDGSTLESLSVIYPSIQISSFGQSGQPLRNEAIMRFGYISQSTNRPITHYCLVKDVTTGTIIDSYSGIEKSWDVYGGPGAWAVYVNNTPIVAQPDVPTAETSQPDTFTITDNSVVTEPLNAPEPLPDDDSVVIPVKVIKPDPNSWQATYRPGLGILDTTSIKNITITDLSGEQPDRELIAGTKVPIAGRFEKDGVVYYRTEKSVTDNVWYGVPAGTLIRSDKFEQDDDINDIYESPDETTKNKVIKTAAKIEGKTRKLFSFGRE